MNVSTENGTLRAVIYCRVSTKEQVQNMSLSTQERECRLFCEREGYEVDSVFREKGESAAYTDDDARVVRRIPATQSEGRRPVVPREAGHLIRRNGAACRSVATRVVQLCLSFLPDGLVGVKSLVFRFRIDSPFRVMV